MVRGHRRLVLLGALAVCGQALAADRFHCDDLAKFGYTDWLCESPTEIARIQVIEPIRPGAADTASDAAPGDTGFDAGSASWTEIDPQGRWVARRTWASPRPIDSLTPPYSYPGYSFYENNQFDVRLPFRLIPRAARPGQLGPFGFSP